MIKKIVIAILIFIGLLCVDRFISYYEKNYGRDERSVRQNANSTAAHNDIGPLGELVAKRKKVRFLLSGMDNLVQCKQVALSLSFMSNEAYEKEAAMDLAKSLMTEWWSVMLSRPFYAEYIQDLRERGLHRDFYFEPRRFGLKLSFWDDKVRRRPEPFVSQIRVCDGKIYCYYRQKDSEALQEPTVETFEEAGWKFNDVPPIPVKSNQPHYCAPRKFH